MFKYKFSFNFLYNVIIVFVFSLKISCYAQEVSNTKQQLGKTQKIGDAVLLTLPVATLATSLIVGDKKGAWQFTKGLLLTAGLTQSLKFTINKQRPDMSNNNSFPSGHTSTVFHSASYIHERYGFKHSIPAYLLAGFTAASRIESRKHDLLDVVAGAAIGLGSNLLFTTKYKQYHMVFTYNKHMIGFRYKF